MTGLVLAFAGPLLVAAGFLPLRDSVAGAKVGMVMLLPPAMAAAVGGPAAAVTAVLVGSVMHYAF